MTCCIRADKCLTEEVSIFCHLVVVCVYCTRAFRSDPYIELNTDKDFIDYR